MTIPKFLERLVSNEGWDYAVLQFKAKPPMAIQNKIAICAFDGENVTLEVAAGPHPLDDEKQARASHFHPLSDITGISYYVESRIVTKPGKLAKIK